MTLSHQLEQDSHSLAFFSHQQLLSDFSRKTVALITNHGRSCWKSLAEEQLRKNLSKVLPGMWSPENLRGVPVAAPWLCKAFLWLWDVSHGFQAVEKILWYPLQPHFSSPSANLLLLESNSCARVTCQWRLND
ncbi:hypothetical protein EK904_002313 [Melospiza melodia maxima]|nr:hypothetical protein EK904_002313 [Melospiza melodia maxima]